MSELKIYKFIFKNELEYHSVKKEEKVENFILFVPFNLIEEWAKILGDYILDKEGIPIIMKSNYFCFLMKDICDSLEIEMENIFEDKD